MKNTTLCYLEQDGCWLMLYRPPREDDANQEKWLGVGGKCEEGESPEDCILREVLEETGLRLLRYRYRGLVTFVSDRWPTEYMHLFTSDAFAGSIRPSDEGELLWVQMGNVPLLPIWEGDRIFLRLLEENAPFFSLKLVYAGNRLTQAFLDGAPLPGTGGHS